ncbi:MAG: hypothetical protein KF774_14980 [Planctomyces sp.]|nr:hypothetical protein [Planctomyces sp.]
MIRQKLIVAAGLAALPVAGCRPADSTATAPTGQQSSQSAKHDHDHDHDHGTADEHPETFAAAVQAISTARDAIRGGFEANDLQRADGPLHAIGHVLEDLQELAKSANLSEEQLAEVKTATDALFGGFGELDKTIHGSSEGKTWSDVEQEVNQAVESLERIAAGSGPGETR